LNLRWTVAASCMNKWCPESHQLIWIGASAVIRGSRLALCPFHPRKRTSEPHTGVSGMGQERTHAPQQNGVVIRSARPNIGKAR